MPGCTQHGRKFLITLTLFALFALFARPQIGDPLEEGLESHLRFSRSVRELCSPNPPTGQFFGTRGLPQSLALQNMTLIRNNLSVLYWTFLRDDVTGVE
jgi:hypothetical protein